MRSTKIEWTDKTWNPITGCTKHSAGCLYCYAETMAKRLKAMKQDKYHNGFQLTLHEECLCEPMSWKKAHNIFVCSMSDLFHEEVPDTFIEKIMDTIRATPHHRYQILTKRAERMADYFKKHDIPNNIWLGVTVECKSVKNRIDYLKSIPVSVHFLSCEPLIESLGDLDLNGIEWVIVGGESGPLARPMKEEWVLEIKEHVEKCGASFFFKQWGTWGCDGIKRNKRENGKLLRGKIVQEMPSKI